MISNKNRSIESIIIIIAIVPMIAYKQGVTLYNKLFSGKFPMIPVVNLIAPVGFGLMNVPVLTQVIQKPIETRQMVKNTDSQLTLTTKFRFANYHKPAP